MSLIKLSSLSPLQHVLFAFQVISELESVLEVLGFKENSNSLSLSLDRPRILMLGLMVRWAIGSSVTLPSSALILMAPYSQLYHLIGKLRVSMMWWWRLRMGQWTLGARSSHCWCECQTSMTTVPSFPDHFTLSTFLRTLQLELSS